MKKILIVFFIFFYPHLSFAESNDKYHEKYFYIGKMKSHHDKFTLFFKTREKAIIAKGENSNYINDFPKDLYIYNYKTKESLPLISYEWFPKTAKYFLQDYNFPVFPDDFAYYLLKDNKTLVMISAVKSLKANFKFDIIDKKLELYPANGKFDFIISSIAKDCGHYRFKDNYKCSFYKPLISSTLIK